jgi:uncharacterized membrane protein
LITTSSLAPFIVSVRIFVIIVTTTHADAKWTKHKESTSERWFCKLQLYFLHVLVCPKYEIISQATLCPYVSTFDVKELKVRRVIWRQFEQNCTRLVASLLPLLGPLILK